MTVVSEGSWLHLRGVAPLSSPDGNTLSKDVWDWINQAKETKESIMGQVINHTFCEQTWAIYDGGNFIWEIWAVT